MVDMTNGVYTGSYAGPATSAARHFFHASIRGGVGMLSATYYVATNLATVVATPFVNAPKFWRAEADGFGYTSAGSVGDCATNGNCGPSTGTAMTFTMGAATSYMVRYTGFFRPAASATHTFRLAYASATAQQRFRLWINGRAVIDSWTSAPSAGPTVSTLPLALVSTLDYDVTLDYAVTFTGGNFAPQHVVSVDPGTGTYGTISSSNLYLRYDVVGSPQLVYSS
jgi:hypothetical protein